MAALPALLQRLEWLAPERGDLLLVLRHRRLRDAARVGELTTGERVEVRLDRPQVVFGAQSLERQLVDEPATSVQSTLIP